MSAHTTHHSFADAERWSKVFDAEDRAEWQKPDEVVALMEITDGMTVVDLGAGTGYFLGRLSAAVGEGGKVLALDVEPNLIDFMTERGEREGWTHVEPRRIPYDDPQLPDASVDRILVVDTWHHIAERPAYAAKLLKALKPGGGLFVVDLTRESPHGPPVEERLPPEQISKELAEGGFRVEVAEETLPYQFVVVGRR
jgi:ubiquinone/menaquinone biosynthesis C-methylase UbiE